MNKLKPDMQRKEYDTGDIGMLSERDVQNQIVDWLRLRGWQVYEFAKPGARPKCPKCGAWVGSIVTAPEAWPDLVVVQVGWVVFVEVKTPRGRLSKTQQVLHAELREAGCQVYVVRSLEDIWEVFGNEWGDE